MRLEPRSLGRDEERRCWRMRWRGSALMAEKTAKCRNPIFNMGHTRSSSIPRTLLLTGWRQAFILFDRTLASECFGGVFIWEVSINGSCSQ